MDVMPAGEPDSEASLDDLAPEAPDSQTEGAVLAFAALAISALVAAIVFALVPVALTVLGMTGQRAPALLRVLAQRGFCGRPLVVRRDLGGTEEVVEVRSDAELRQHLPRLFNSFPPDSGSWITGAAPEGVRSVELSLHRSKCHVILEADKQLQHM